MSEAIVLSNYLKSLPSVESAGSLTLILLSAAGDLSVISPSKLQRSVMTPQQTVDLDHPERSGIFNISSATGTKPASYGIVISASVGINDTYQLAICSNNQFYFRANTNGTVNNWLQVAKAT